MTLRSQITKLRLEQQQFFEQIKQSLAPPEDTPAEVVLNHNIEPVLADTSGSVTTLIDTLREDVFLMRLFAAQVEKVEKQTAQLLVALSREQGSTLERLKNLDQQLESHSRQLRSITESVGMFERVLAGPSLKGRLGERIVEQQLQILPGDWIARNVRFSDGRVVEFALRMPDGKIVPIDSKWTSTPLLDLHGQQTDETIRRQLEDRIRNDVTTRALEVLKYLDKDRTLSFCIAAVPDAVFQICQPIQAFLAARHIVLVSYSLLVPYIIMLVDFANSNIQAARLLQTSTSLKRTLFDIQMLQQEIDTKIRKTFDGVQLQQSHHISYNQRLQAVAERLKRLEEEIVSLRSDIPGTLNPMDPAELSQIPKGLKVRLDQLRESIASLTDDTE